MSTDPLARAWVEVRASALRRNVQTVRDAVGEDVALVPMVKADAYGLGVAEVVRVLEPLEPWGYGVAAVAEGLRLRELGVRRRVVVFTPLPPDSYGDAVAADLGVAVSELDALRRLRDAAEAAGRPGIFHLEVDTGMGRAGFDWRRREEWGPRVAAFAEQGLVWEGCFTHFHSADEGDPGSVREQWKRLREVLEDLPLPASGVLVHACNSPGALRCPEYAADAVRPGIFLYGGVAGEGLPAPEPVVAVRARITLVRRVPPGTTVGYGATYRASREETWATVAIGYGDGLPWALGNRGHALVRGRRAPIVGRISMDLTVLDVTEIGDVRPGEVATFVGRDGEEEISLEEVAELAGTINYEILTGLGGRLPRTWRDDAGY